MCVCERDYRINNDCHLRLRETGTCARNSYREVFIFFCSSSVRNSLLVTIPVFTRPTKTSSRRFNLDYAINNFLGERMKQLRSMKDIGVLWDKPGDCRIRVYEAQLNDQPVQMVCMSSDPVRTYTIENKRFPDFSCLEILGMVQRNW